MTQLTSYELKHFNAGVKIVSGSFAPAGTSAPTAVKGRGFSVTRTGVGLYLLTFRQPYAHMLSALADIRLVAPIGYEIKFGAYSAANKTLAISVLKVSTMSIPLDVAAAREIAGDAIQNLAAHGGLLASDSVPALARVNAATDKALRVVWAATEVDEIQFPPVPKPADLDAGSDVIVRLMISKGTNTDTAAVIDVQAWDGIGDTEMGGNTPALAVATLAEYAVTLANANIAAAPGFLNIGIVPGAHANDIIYLYSALLEYTQKLLADIAADADNRISFDVMFQDGTTPVA